ncbi:ABC transporter ATP-binding protein [Nitrospira moscoviensis]|uniref:ABC transporter, ATP-binding protein n=1 Tax=Nitrospira moscoviensis TaxID=42253 RepID=A0A0K2GC30_NITMO|nr:ATP-binding cassette domain-containing protein [Nitrospira moscoviensis]ALA58172.1 ABC transporter, ATP-binding protein [Nitrospira moscoviensis]
MTGSAPPLISLRGVSLTLDGKPVLQDVSFDVAQGETKVILGGSGSGKTTILRLVLGLFKPDRGSITVGGKDIGRLSDRQLAPIRRNMAMVFQSAALFDSLSVRENVGYRLWEEGRLPDAEVEEIVRQSLQFVGLEEVIDKMPGELSGGMRKRVGIARALASGAPLLLYDEPTAGLDPVNAFAIGHLILQLKAKGVTQVVVTHDLDLAFRVADHLVMIQRGCMVFTGSPLELAGKQDAEIRGFLDPSSLPAEDWNTLPSRLSQ